MKDSDFIDFEDRTYVNPQVTVDNTNKFVENLRNVQSSENDRINKQTYNLGTQVPSTSGGLGGAKKTYETRYVTPKVNSMIAGLKETAQQSALNTAMTNLQNEYQNRYNQAYRNAVANATSGTGTGTEDTQEDEPVDVNTNPDDDDTEDVEENPNTGAGYLVPDSDTTGKYVDPNTGETYTLTEPTNFQSLIIKGHSIEFNKNAVNGGTYTINGVTYRYIKNTQYPNGAWFVQK